MRKQGGDRKSAKFHMDQESRKKGFLITDFMARKKSKEMHLKHPKVISAQVLYDKEYKVLNTIKTELVEMDSFGRL